MRASAPLAVLILLLSGCLQANVDVADECPAGSAIQWRLTGHDPEAWSKVPAAAVRPPWRGWAIEDWNGPGPAANVTHIVWRSDGGDPWNATFPGFAPLRSAPGAEEAVQIPTYGLRAPTNASPALLSARYSPPAPEEQVAADIEMFLSMLGVGDRRPIVEAFVQDPALTFHNWTSSNGTVHERLHATEYSAEWPFGIPPAADRNWTGRYMWRGALAMRADLSTARFGDQDGNSSLWVNVEPEGRIFVQLVALADGTDGEAAIRGYLDEFGINVDEGAELEALTYSLCHPVTGEVRPHPPPAPRVSGRASMPQTELP